MFHTAHVTDPHARLSTPADELSAGLDPDFDPGCDDLEREFQALRFQLRHFE